MSFPKFRLLSSVINDWKRRCLASGNTVSDLTVPHVSEPKNASCSFPLGVSVSGDLGNLGLQDTMPNSNRCVFPAMPCGGRDQSTKRFRSGRPPPLILDFLTVLLSASSGTDAVKREVVPRIRLSTDSRFLIRRHGPKNGEGRCRDASDFNAPMS